MSIRASFVLLLFKSVPAPNFPALLSIIGDASEIARVDGRFVCFSFFYHFFLRRFY